MAGGVSVSGRQPRPSTVHPSSPGGVTFPGTFAAFSSFLTRNSHSKPSCLPQNGPCDSCLRPRALWDSVYLTEQSSGCACWRRRAGACQRGVLSARVFSAGERGQAVSPGAACGRANVSADAASIVASRNRHWWSLVWDGDSGWGRGAGAGADGQCECGWTLCRGEKMVSMRAHARVMEMIGGSRCLQTVQAATGAEDCSAQRRVIVAAATDSKQERLLTGSDSSGGTDLEAATVVAAAAAMGSKEAAVAAAAGWRRWLVGGDGRAADAAADAAVTDCSENLLPPGSIPGVTAWGLWVPSQGRGAILRTLGLSRATGCRSCGPSPDG